MSWVDDLENVETQTILGYSPLSPKFDILYGDKIGNPPSTLPPFLETDDVEEEEGE